MCGVFIYTNARVQVALAPAEERGGEGGNDALRTSEHLAPSRAKHMLHMLQMLRIPPAAG